jgi:transcriptional regulator GlxA family with amidase domain
MERAAAGPKPDSRRVVILVFEDAEVLDVCGPFEVFSIAGRRHDLVPFEVGLVAEHPGSVALRNGFSVNPQWTIDDCPPADLLVVPGGFGTRREMNNPVLLEWVRQRAETAELVLSVCTGSLILGKAGLLDGLEVTTHFGAMDLLRQSAPRAHVRTGGRFWDNGKVITSAGVSAGLDMSLHVVARLLGDELAEEAADYMEYHWDRGEEGMGDEGL